jgi:hypothetical protein
VLFTSDVVQERVRQGPFVQTAPIARGYTSVDVSTGKRLAQLSLGAANQLSHLGQVGGRLWFYDHATARRLHARRPDTLQPSIDARELVRRNPALAAGLASGDRPDQLYVVDRKTRRLYVTTTDGRGFWLDPSTLAVVEPAQTRPVWRVSERPRFSRKVETRAGAKVALAGAVRQTVMVEGGVEPASSGTPPGGAAFIEGDFVTDGVERSGARGRALESPNGYLFIVHRRSVGAKGGAMVSAVDPAKGFAVAWSTDLGDLSPRSTSDYPTAAVAGGLLVLAGELRAVALDVSTGATRWTYRF